MSVLKSYPGLNHHVDDVTLRKWNSEIIVLVLLMTAGLAPGSYDFKSHIHEI